MKPILILGLGNPLQGDDGIGCRVVEALESQDLPEAVELVDGGTPGIGLLGFLQDRERVILVDAAEMGEPPGTCRFFRREAVTLTGSAARFSLHRTGVAEALELARALNLRLAEILFVGVQPMQVGWNTDLSLPVRSAIPGIVAAIRQEVDRPLTRGPSDRRLPD